MPWPAARAEAEAAIAVKSTHRQADDARDGHRHRQQIGHGQHPHDGMQEPRRPTRPLAAPPPPTATRRARARTEASAMAIADMHHSTPRAQPADGRHHHDRRSDTSREARSRTAPPGRPRSRRSASAPTPGIATRAIIAAISAAGRCRLERAPKEDHDGREQGRQKFDSMGEDHLARACQRVSVEADELIGSAGVGDDPIPAVDGHNVDPGVDRDGHDRRPATIGHARGHSSATAISIGASTTL